MRLTHGLSSSVVFLVLASAAVGGTTQDAWITVKAKVGLLTAEDVAITAMAVDARDGLVTLHGKVASEAEKRRAETVVSGVEGVRGVRNLLQVVPQARQELVKQSDKAIEAKVQQCLAKDAALRGLRVASVNDGVVLLAGEVRTPQEELRAIETVRACTSVRRVASEIKTGQ